MLEENIAKKTNLSKALNKAPNYRVHQGSSEVGSSRRINPLRGSLPFLLIFPFLIHQQTFTGSVDKGLVLTGAILESMGKDVQMIP